MDCDICSKELNNRRKPICASCAQASLHLPRVQQVVALLDREKQHSHAEAVVRPGNDGVIATLPEDADWDVITAGIKKHSLHRLQAEKADVERRISDITEKAEELRRQIDGYKAYAAMQRRLQPKRKEEVGNEGKQLESHKPRVMDPVQSDIMRVHHKLERVHKRTSDARRLLCREAAVLSGLSRSKGTDGKYEYWLGGGPIIDLRDLNGRLASDITGLDSHEKDPLQTHDLISASLGNVARLLGNCCHYLSIRLPAELVLPHNDSPLAMIMPEKSSYKYKDLSRPCKSSSQSPSPAASRLVDRHGLPVPTPRLLHLDRRLPQLLKEDSKAFHMFVEGVTLLAWDVAWLCKTQGIDNVDSFDGVCAVGKNLYQLFLGEDKNRPSLSRNPSSTIARKGDRVNSAMPWSTVRFGSYSHGSAHHLLSSHEGVRLLRGWRLSSPARLVDKVMSSLLNEISGAEWDFLSGEEWDDERVDEVAVLVGGQRRPLDRHGPAMSVMSVRPSDGFYDEETMDSQRRKGSAGWMKVRGRGGDG